MFKKDFPFQEFKNHFNQEKRKRKEANFWRHKMKLNAGRHTWMKLIKCTTNGFGVKLMEMNLPRDFPKV